MPIKFEVPGQPVGKGRPRFVRKTGHAYTPKKTQVYEDGLRRAGEQAMRDDPLLTCPISLYVCAYFQVPKSWSKKKQQLAYDGVILPTGRPDGDNVLKAVGDALNGVVWRDDSQVVFGQIKKLYSLEPKTEVTVFAMREYIPATGV